MRFLNRLFRYEAINGHGACPTYLHRWTLLRIGKRLAVYLHRFVGDDWSREFHDHPKRFVSIGLWGAYVEETPHPTRLDWIRTQAFIAPWIRSFPATHQHRIRTWPGQECWTLVIVGPKVREWGFWHDGAFMPWEQYVSDRELVAAVKSCD